MIKFAIAVLLLTGAPVFADGPVDEEAPQLALTLSAKSLTVKQGFPLTFQVLARNVGSEPFVYHGINNGFWRRMSLLHRHPGEKGEPRRSGFGDAADCTIAMGNLLQPGASLTIPAFLARYHRKGPLVQGGRARLVPCTDTVGTYSFWVESYLEAQVLTSPVLKIEVLPPGEDEKAALKFLLAMPNLDLLYYGWASRPKTFDDITTLACDKGDNGYADMARMRVAECYLRNARMTKDEYRERVFSATGMYSADCLKVGRMMMGMIDMEHFPQPRCVPAIQQLLARAEEAHGKVGEK